MEFFGGDGANHFIWIFVLFVSFIGSLLHVDIFKTKENENKSKDSH